MSWAEDRAAPGDGDCKHVWPWMRADEAIRRGNNRAATDHRTPQTYVAHYVVLRYRPGRDRCLV